MSFAAAAVIKATLALLLGCVATMLFHRAAAATRHTMLVAAQVAALLVPLLAFFVPHVNVEVAPLTRRPVVAQHALETPAVAAHIEVVESSPSRGNVIAIIWAFGVVIVVAKRSFGLIGAIALVRRARRCDGVLFSDEVEQPVTFGSHIVLPSAATQWSAARLHAVLAHERAHVARRDSLQAAIGDVVCVMYWFHPLAWITSRQAALAREQACDDIVLAEGIAPAAYATAILDVARTLQRRHAYGLPMATRSQLEVRLRAILDEHHVLRATRSARIGVIAVAIACAPLLAALTPRGIEPDLLGDAYASPFSEHIAVDTIPNVAAAGPDAALIATMQKLACRAPQHEIDFVADRARWALGQVRNGELFVPLAASLHDSDWRVRAYAAWGLSVAGDSRATDDLLPLLDDPIWRVRAMAASALADIADPAAAPAMRRALEDDAWQVRTPAVSYFRAIGAERSLFRSMLDDRHVQVRTAAQEALQ